MYEGKKAEGTGKIFYPAGRYMLVEVNREIYLEWYQSRRKERYQKERDQEYGVFSIEKLHEKGYFPEQSLNRDTTLEAVLRNECRNGLENALRKLPEQDIRLVRFLYFDEMTVKKTAEIFGCSRKTIQNRRRRILEKMKDLMSEISP